jgi:hypothetical protein
MSVKRIGIIAIGLEWDCQRRCGPQAVCDRQTLAKGVSNSSEAAVINLQLSEIGGSHELKKRRTTNGFRSQRIQHAL